MNSIHPSAQIVGDVQMGTGNTVGPFAVIVGPVALGDDNWVGTGVVIGASPEVRGRPVSPDSGRPGDGNGILIGDSNVFREYAQIHHGWHDITRVGDEGFVMNQAYIAHDCQLGDRVTLASSVLLAGHVRLGADVNIGLGAVVHQRRYIGSGAMIGMGAVVTRDVPPFAKAFGNPARVRGANSIGMERSGFAPGLIESVSVVYGRRFDPARLSELIAGEEIAEALAEWNLYTQGHEDE